MHRTDWTSSLKSNSTSLLHRRVKLNSRDLSKHTEMGSHYQSKTMNNKIYFPGTFWQVADGLKDTALLTDNKLENRTLTAGA